MGEPDSQQEQNYGDAGGAILVGTENILAEMPDTQDGFLKVKQIL